MITDSATGRTLIYDAFVRNGRLYLISQYMSAMEPPMNIEIAGHNLVEVGRNEGEPVRYFYCDLGDTIPPHVTINGKQYALKIGQATLWKGGFAVATLFRHDAPYIGNMVAWYREQGCTAFYLYYNGTQLPPGLPTGPDIEYFLWPFRYHNKATLPGEPERWTHNAQPAFLTSARFKHMPAHDWMALIDVDEHVWPGDGVRLADALAVIPEVDANCVRVPCHWALRHVDGITYTTGADWGRGKLIYRGTYSGLCGVHVPKPGEDVRMLDRADFRMLHCVNYGHIDRIKRVAAPTEEVRWQPAEKVECLTWQVPANVTANDDSD